MVGVREVWVMALETKVILLALGKIAKLSKDPRVIYNAIADMANVEGVVMEPYEDEETTN